MFQGSCCVHACPVAHLGLDIEVAQAGQLQAHFHNKPAKRLKRGLQLREVLLRPHIRPASNHNTRTSRRAPTQELHLTFKPCQQRNTAVDAAACMPAKVACAAGVALSCLQGTHAGAVGGMQWQLADLQYEGNWAASAAPSCPLSCSGLP